MEVVKSPLKKSLIFAPGKLYELAVRLRIAAYETGYRRSKSLRSPLISIGNITLGGTGKTPLVRYAADYLASEGYRVAILTRGYGRKSRGQRVLNANCSGAGIAAATGAGPPNDSADNRAALRSCEEYGDEPLMLSRMLPDVPIVINANRIEGGRFAERELSAEVLILDDGYQHLAISRDLNLLVLDATDPFGGGTMVPFGRLREPLYALKRADAVVVTRADRAFDQDRLIGTVKYVCGQKIPILYVYSEFTYLRHFEGGLRYTVAEFADWNALVMCGIGNPRAFRDDVTAAGLNVVGERFFKDHHSFGQDEIDSLNKHAQEAGANLILTTEKDAARLEGLRMGSVPVYIAESALRSDDEVRLKSLMLKSLLSRQHT